MKIKIGKYSSENRVSAAARRFSAELGRDINPSTIRGFKRAYLQELDRKRRAEEDDLTVTSLPAKKRGPRAPPTTSWRGLHMRLAKLNLAKILPQYKGRAIGENFTPIQRTGYWRKFYPANFLSYMALSTWQCYGQKLQTKWCKDV